MKYMLMIIGKASPWWDKIDPTQTEAAMKRHQEFRTWLDANGVEYSGGRALLGPEAAQTVREKDGDVIVTDGPYADLKEVIGGFYVIDAPDAATAAEIARHCPLDPATGIEVRPFWER